MKDTPILFSGEMVRAILAGRKTMTRRVIKRPTVKGWGLTRMQDGFPEGTRPIWGDDEEPNLCSEVCPYGGPGDRLWVRETWAPDPVIKPAVYRASFPYPVTTPVDGRWRPSIYMPRWASRIALEVTGVRVERVQEITEGEAIAEGVTLPEVHHPVFERGAGGFYEMTPYRTNFMRLWNGLNRERGFGWDVNPWVWVVSFRWVGGE